MKRPTSDAAIAQSATAIAHNYQSTIDTIERGRYEVTSKLQDYWNDWYNALMAICFALGGGLIAVGATVHLKLAVGAVLLWAAAVVFVATGLYILLLRKQFLATESAGLLRMGYEMEYYALLARNSMFEVAAGVSSGAADFVRARDRLLDISLRELEEAYAQGRTSSDHIDAVTALFLLGLLLTALAGIGSRQWLELMSVVGLAALGIVLYVLRLTSRHAKQMLIERDKWLRKVIEARQKLADQVKGK